MDIALDGVVAEASAANADEFLEAIEPRRSPFFKGSTRDHSEWIFRGHGDASWGLLPSLLRDRTKFWLHGAWGSVDWTVEANARNRAHVFREALVVARFFSLADRHGLPLPEDSQRLRSQLSRITGTRVLESIAALEQWPPDDLLPVLALAQHHGLPTRLLDWTYNPFTAAYFAAKGAIARGRNELLAAYVKGGGAPGWSNHRQRDLGAICVWILRSTYLRENADLHEPGRDSLVLVTAPTASNPNLRAQEGVFTITRSRLVHDAPVDRRPLTETLRELMHPRLMERFQREAAKSGFGEKDCPVLVKVKLPASEAPAVLRQLALLGTSAAKLFPGYQGVVDSMKDEEIWDHLNR